MKVGFFNKKIWKHFSVFVSALAGAVSLILAFIDIDQDLRLKIGISFVGVLITVYIVMLIVANKKTSQTIRINDTDVKIEYGDIFEQDGVKVIAFNEFFDTQVDNHIISQSSLNGQYIAKRTGGAEAIDSVIESDVHIKQNICEIDVNRSLGGKTIRYSLGSICADDNYFLLAFTRFDNDNRAYLSVADYISCLMNMWNELDILYSGRPIVMPLLGSGITRLKNELSAQELLNELIWTYRASRVRFSSSLTIVIPEVMKKQITLFDVGKE